MYSQFQQYSNPPQSATSVQNRTWNGSAWVSAPNGTTYTSYASQQVPSNGPTNHSTNAGFTQSLVQKYTDYYHTWLSQQEQHQTYAQSLPHGSSERNQALQHAETCRSYAEASSLAANHFHNNPNLTTAPFSLPPAPPAASQPSVPNNNTSNNNTSPSRRYIDKCLGQCVTQSEKSNMMKEVERLISGLMKEGSYQSVDWDNLELIPVPGRSRVPEPVVTYPDPPSSSYYASPAQTSGTSYYGPASTNGPHTGSYYGAAAPRSSKKKRGFSSSAPSHENAGYYGPTDTSLSLQVTKSKKNKKGGFNTDDGVLGDRARRFAGPGGIKHAHKAMGKPTSNEYDRFMGKATIGGSNKVLTESDFENMTVKGTCTVLEKNYLRLTEPPKAEKVRPEPILRQHLLNLKEERKKDSRRDYLWFCSQFKALRQDCTVQRIQNDFTVDVYETHAHIALEEGDVNEFNQCQTQLKYLYDLLSTSKEALKNLDEFLAYRVLYYVFLMGNPKYQGGSSDLLQILLLLSKKKNVAVIQHALRVREAWSRVDYHGFFVLYRSCPNRGKYLMEPMLGSMRYKGLQRICQAYRPSVEVAFVLKELGFEENISFGLEWLVSCGCLLNDEKSTIRTKESSLRESDMEVTKSLI